MLTVNKEICDITELLDFERNTIIDCKVKLLNIFTKELTEGRTGVYGDYDILLLYTHGARRKSKYEVRNIKKTFFEVFSSKEYFKDNDEEKQIEGITFKPICKFNLKNRHHSGSYYEIEVVGNIQITYDSEENEVIKVDENTASEPHDTGPKLESEVLQFHENSNYSINQLMNMDLDLLKKISKNNKACEKK
jgi:hypothetical protein